MHNLYIYLKSFFALAIILASLLFGFSNGDRVKRIVGGHYLRDRDPKFVPYDNVRYFAYIENGHSCDQSPSWWERWGKWIISGWCAPRKNSLSCGGALITPKIIQTACHCTADFNLEDEESDRWAPAVGRNAWQEGLSAYMGLNDIDDFKWKIHVYSMWPHPRCAKLQSTGTITHDLGWMYLEFSVLEDLLNYQDYFIDYAPLYKMDTLERLYEEAFTKELVCLVIGFGIESEEATEGSEVLKHTWVQLLPNELCYWLTATWKAADGWNVHSLLDPENYKNYSSWVCSVPFNGFFQGGFHSSGDSGSPVTCNDNYFSVVSTHAHTVHPRAGVTILMRQHAIKYAPNENAAEYRADFIELVDNEDWQYEVDDEFRSLMHQRTKNQLFVSMQRPLASNVSHLKGKSSLSVSTNLVSGCPPAVMVNPALETVFLLFAIFL